MFVIGRLCFGRYLCIYTCTRNRTTRFIFGPFSNEIAHKNASRCNPILRRDFASVACHANLHVCFSCESAWNSHYQTEDYVASWYPLTRAARAGKTPLSVFAVTRQDTRMDATPVSGCEPGPHSLTVYTIGCPTSASDSKASIHHSMLLRPFVVFSCI